MHNLSNDSGPAPVVPISSDDPDNPHTPEWSEGYMQGVNEANRYLRNTAPPVWPPTVCPAWCSYVGDHAPTEGTHPVDRYHSYNFESEEAESVYLSLHRKDLADPGSETHEAIPQRLALDMRQPYREVEPTVYLSHMNRGWRRSGPRPDFTIKPRRQLKLTPGEARQLGQRLLMLARMAGAS